MVEQKHVLQGKIPSFMRAGVTRIRNEIYRSRLRRLLHRLHPRCDDKELVRFGPMGDGGYLLPDDIGGIGACFSPGVSSISGFEKQCAELGIPVYLADASVEIGRAHV